MDSLTFGILTASDTCYKNEKQDTAGPSLEVHIRKQFPDAIFVRKIVPDDLAQIKETLEMWSQNLFNIIFTVGGTGFSPRDVTPEATRAVIEREAPGLAYAMLSRSLLVTDMAMLSRAVCGIKSQTLIVNLPGSAKAAAECFGFIKKSIPHAIAVLTDNKDLIVKEHEKVQEQPTESKVKMNVASRARHSPYPMIEVSKAIEIIRKECTPTIKIEEVPFDKSINRVLAEDICAVEPFPPFRASIKDGYAVRSIDGESNRVIRKVIAAGDKPGKDELKENQAVRISTGAVVPPGADAVVQVENTTLVESEGTEEKIISIKGEVVSGQDIRAIGSDISAGTVVLNKYDRVTPACVGVLAMLGITKVKVFAQPSIGILSTGNEIKDPGEQLEPGQIRDSNRSTLIHLLKKYGYDSTDYGITRDDPNSIKNTLEKAFTRNDVVITTGGVSMGEFDVLKQVLIDDFNAYIHFARVNMKPGKPTTFATFHYKGQLKIFFGLPGNPVSCSVTSLLFVIPTLKFVERSRIDQFPTMSVSCRILENLDERPEYHRVRVTVSNGKLSAESTGNQISSRLNSMVGANGLIVVKKTGKVTNYNNIYNYNTIIFDDII